MDTISFTLIGFGGIAKTHLLSACDANIRQELPFRLECPAVLTRKEKSLPLPGMKNYQSFDTMLRENRLDFIDICTPNDAHLEYVRRAAELGRAIYCEKPLAESLSAAEEMAEIIRKANVPSAVAFMYRMVPAIRILKEEVQKGSVGKVIHFRSSMYHSSYLSPKKAGAWRTGAQSGGGALVDLGSHLIDLVQDILGDIVEIKADLRIQFPERTAVDEYAYCDVTLADGTRGSIECSRISAETENRDWFEIYGEKGSLKADMRRPCAVERYSAETGETTLLTADSALLKKLHHPGARASLGFHQSAHTSSLIEFAQSLYSGEKSSILADFEDALKVQRVLEQAYRG